MKEPKQIKSIADIPEEERGISIAAGKALRNVWNWKAENPELSKTHRPHIAADGSVTIEPIEKIIGEGIFIPM